MDRSCETLDGQTVERRGIREKAVKMIYEPIVQRRNEPLRALLVAWLNIHILFRWYNKI
jgi:hypothetical protein